MTKRTLKQAEDEINTLSILLKQHIATENALRVRLAKANQPATPVVRPRRMDDGQWAVFRGQEQMGLFEKFSDCAAKCKELATAH